MARRSEGLKDWEERGKKEVIEQHMRFSVDIILPMSVGAYHDFMEHMLLPLWCAQLKIKWDTWGMATHIGFDSCKSVMIHQNALKLCLKGLKSQWNFGMEVWFKIHIFVIPVVSLTK